MDAGNSIYVVGEVIHCVLTNVVKNNNSDVCPNLRLILNQLLEHVRMTFVAFDKRYRHRRWLVGLL